MCLTLEADETMNPTWSIDAAYGVYGDCKGQSGGSFTLGKGSIQTVSCKQKINTKSSSNTIEEKPMQNAYVPNAEFNTCDFCNINKVCEDYKEKIRGRLKPYQEVMIQHTIFALNKLDRGNFYHLPSLFTICVSRRPLC